MRRSIGQIVPEVVEFAVPCAPDVGTHVVERRPVGRPVAGAVPAADRCPPRTVDRRRDGTTARPARRAPAGSSRTPRGGRGRRSADGGPESVARTGLRRRPARTARRCARAPPAPRHAAVARSGRSETCVSMAHHSAAESPPILPRENLAESMMRKGRSTARMTQPGAARSDRHPWTPTIVARARAADEAPMKSVTLEIDEATDRATVAPVRALRHHARPRCRLLCGSLDRETLARVIQRAIKDDSVTSEPGVADAGAACRLRERRRERDQASRPAHSSSRK